jgi:hypothetical protein
MKTQDSNLHLVVASELSRIAPAHGCCAVVAPECNGSHRLPLFADVYRNRETNYCWVDAVIIGGSNTVIAVIEIEQCGIPKPSMLCGKILPIGLCRYLHTNSEGLVALDRNLTFIHIVNSERVKPHSRKLIQYANIEAAVRNILPIGSVNAYHVIAATASAFGNGGTGSERISCGLSLVCGK